MLYNHNMLLRFDGASRGNPGPASSGFVLYSATGAKIGEGYFRHPSPMTCNQAEYLALIAGLRKAKEMGARGLTIEGDSKLVIEQVFGDYKVRSPNICAHYQTAIKLVQGFDERIIGRWIPREQNSEADALANRALDAPKTITTDASLFEVARPLSVLEQFGGTMSQDQAAQQQKQKTQRQHRKHSRKPNPWAKFMSES